MPIDLQAKRESLAADFVAMQKYDPHWRREAESGKKITERPVAFIRDDEVVVLAADAAQIVAGLRDFQEHYAGQYAGRKHEPAVAALLSKVERYASDPEPAELRVPQPTWNALVWALGDAGIDVVLSDGSNP